MLAELRAERTRSEEAILGLECIAVGSSVVDALRWEQMSIAHHYSWPTNTAVSVTLPKTSEIT